MSLPSSIEISELTIQPASLKHRRNRELSILSLFHKANRNESLGELVGSGCYEYFNKSIISLILLFYINTANCCDCAFNGGFLKTSYYSELVIKAEVIKHLKTKNNYDNEYYYNGIKVQIKEFIKGQISTDTISIYWNYLISCGLSITPFDIGSNWLFALNKNQNNAFYFSFCTVDHLKILENYITGPILKNDFCTSIQKDSILYDSVKIMIKSPDVFLLPTIDCNYPNTYLWVTDMPTFKPGESALDSLLFKELQLKKSKFEESISLYIEYFIETDGKISNIKLADNFTISEVGKTYFEKIKEVLTKTEGLWYPGRHFNKACRVRILKELNLRQIKTENEGNNSSE